MTILDECNNVKSVGLYTFDDDGKGNIQVYFKINKNNYKLTIGENDLKCMNKISELGKIL